MTERPPLRAARAGVFASVCTAVSVGGHTLTSDHGVPFGGLLAGAALVYAFAWAATGRERGLGAIAGWMAWGQLALHLVFSTAQSAGAHGAHAAGPAAVEAAPGGADMLAAHMAAGAVCAWWLRQGEAALFSYLRLTASALLPLLVLAVPRLTPERVPSSPFPERDAPAPVTPYLRHSLVLRGPPAL
ncbi:MULTISPECIES: hypothetical protein [Nocardiopsis]|uniref:Uncharacterized protein n=1 Tax=Nocardiopsis sinuspersici TaxID=501010 RepID=A0A1V3C3R8_9ACTN|nr:MULTISPECIES: hypothetical protein [Nocardiopsis]OOC55166.1 hypothetical protein NOSIN_16250 [Nocardiopsis sinuspersici]